MSIKDIYIKPEKGENWDKYASKIQDQRFKDLENNKTFRQQIMILYFGTIAIFIVFIVIILL